MSAIENSKSPSERAAWASALPYVIKVAKVSASKKIIDEVLALYLNSNEANSTSSTTTSEEWNEKRYISAVVMAYISKYVIAIVRKYFDEILPVIFIARHDPVEKVRKAWIDVWDEVLTTTPRDAMQLYSKQIAKACFISLNHSSWTLKKQGGKGLLELSKEAGNDISVDLKKEIILQLHDNIRGRIWDGKEFLLQALAETCTAFSSSDIEKGPEEAKLIAKSIDLLLKECQRSIKVNIHKFRAYVAFARILKADPILENLITLQLYNEAKQAFTKELETCSNIDNLIEEEAKTSKEMTFEQKQALAKIKEKEVDVLKAEIYTCISRLIPSKKLVNAQEYSQSVQALIQFLSDKLQTASTIGETQAQLHSLSFALKTYAVSDTIPLITAMAKGLLRAIDSGYNPLPVRNVAVEVISEFISYLKTNQSKAEEQVKSTFLLLKEQLKILEQKEKDYLLQEKMQFIHQREIPQV